MTLSSLTLPAYAKINLTLDVFSKRADGYHSIASVFQTISLADTLTVRRREAPGVGFTCHTDGAEAPADDSNLVVRAARAALDACDRLGQSPGLDIVLEKRIPSQAGLGGGSSDAAATLRAAQRLLDLPLDDRRLASLGAALGSDVPFFLRGGTVAARGRGEILTDLPDVPRHWLVVVKPEESVSTAWAYTALDAVPSRPSHRATKRMEEAIRAGDWDRFVAWQSNDFELSIFAEKRAIAWLADELTMAGAQTARLCGSGSAVYGMAADAAAAERIAELLRRRYAIVHVAHTVNREEALRAADRGGANNA